MSLVELYAFVRWGMQFPALTLMVFTRPDLGYRLLRPLKLVATFGLLAVLSLLLLATPGHEAAHPEHLLIFACIGFYKGLAQRALRWRELNRGVMRHSYYIGTSRFEALWLPRFLRRKRRVAARYIESFCISAIGFALVPFSHLLGVYLVFASSCLRTFEDQEFRRQQNRDLDLMDSIIVAQQEARLLEEYEQTRNPSQQQTSPGIPTGPGEDAQNQRDHEQKKRLTPRN